jgi:preprotein translocase subunit SecD
VNAIRVTNAADSSSPPVFQMRLVADTPSADSEEMLYNDKTVGKKETLHVMKKVLIDQTDVKSAEVIKNYPSQISIKFTDEGKKRLAEVTRENIGKRLAAVIGGQIYSAPKIMSEISIGEATIVVSSEQEAKELVAQITESMKKR